MVGQDGGLLARPLALQGFDGLADGPVQGTPALPQEGLIGDVLDQGMLKLILRHEVARLIVWPIRTRPVVPSTVSYGDVRGGNDPYRAPGQSTHSHSTDARTARGRHTC